MILISWFVSIGILPIPGHQVVRQSIKFLANLEGQLADAVIDRLNGEASRVLTSPQDVTNKSQSIKATTVAYIVWATACTVQLPFDENRKNKL